MTCSWCDGLCQVVDLAPLLHQDLTWLWTQLADCADRRGDTELTAGVISLRIPQSAEERSIAVGLLGGRPLRSGQSRRVDLAELTTRLRMRDPRLTPGLVAAHGAKRRLATKARARAERGTAAERLQMIIDHSVRELPPHVLSRVAPDTVWDRLYRSGWIARLLDGEDAGERVAAAIGVLARLPEAPQRIDRRILVPGNPHALDEGTMLAGLVLAMAGATAPGRRSRDAWNMLQVDYDNLLGGLIALGVRPHGWSLPGNAVITIPPYELEKVRWQPPPRPHSWAFVTENPSVVAAAAEIADARDGPGANGTVYLICTAGTPSDIETKAVANLSAAGWQIAVRADFDPAGLAHVRALLEAAPHATPWRMDAGTYLEHCIAPSTGIEVGADTTPWDPRLAAAMTQRGSPAYEEDLLSELLEDLRAGKPGASC